MKGTLDNVYTNVDFTCSICSRWLCGLSMSDASRFMEDFYTRKKVKAWHKEQKQKLRKEIDDFNIGYSLLKPCMPDVIEYINDSAKHARRVNLLNNWAKDGNN